MYNRARIETPMDTTNYKILFQKPVGNAKHLVITHYCKNILINQLQYCVSREIWKI